MVLSAATTAAKFPALLTAAPGPDTASIHATLAPVVSAVTATVQNSSKGPWLGLEGTSVKKNPKALSGPETCDG